MRRLLLLGLAFLVGASTLFALYVAIDLDFDETSPLVAAPSYESLFQASVRQRTGKTFEALNEARRAKVISDIVASKDMAAVREVALYRARALSNRTATLAMLRKHLLSLPEDLFEVAVGSIAALELPAGRAYLDSLYTTISRDPASSTPLAGYRASTMVVMESPRTLNLVLGERSRDSANYALADASEITFLFPAGPQYVLAMPNADDVLDRWGASRFVRALDGTPVLDDAWTLPMLRTVHGLRKRLTESMGFLGRFFSPEELVRDNLVIARYGTEYLMASHKDKNVAVAEALLSVFEAFGGDIGIRRWSVGGTSAAAIVNKLTGTSLSYATLGDYLVVATDTVLMSRALKTFHSDRGRSIAIDPIFNANYRAVDRSGERDVLFAWFNPSRIVDLTGSEQPAAYRRAVLARATGRPLYPPSVTHVPQRMATLPGIVSSGLMTIDSMSRLWRYVVDVRSLGRSSIDSLAKISGVDVARQIAPYVSSSWVIGYTGVEHLKQEYGFSNTSFNVVAVAPLYSPPPGFESLLAKFFGGMTSLVYNAEPMPNATGQMWIASDTTTRDTTLLERKLQPSFAVLANGLLVVASTPAMLRTSAAMFAEEDHLEEVHGGYFKGMVRLDRFAENSSRYLRSYLLRTDRYAPDEIEKRIEPLAKAIGQYTLLSWVFMEQNGLRTGTAQLGQ